MRVWLDPSYLGQCHCGQDATTKVWCEFGTPIPADPEVGLPEVRGVWTFVCPTHAADPTA